MESYCVRFRIIIIIIDVIIETFSRYDSVIMIVNFYDFIVD